MSGPEWLHRLSSCSPVSAAIGVRLTGDRQAHAVVLYEFERQLYALHFCWMRQWRDEPVGSHDYVWAELPLDPSEVRSFAAFCRFVAEHKMLDGIPFAFRHDALSRIDREKRILVLGPGAHGFTCATFILCLLGSFNFCPIDYDTWQARPCDIEWQHRILEALFEAGHGLEVGPQATEVGCLRFRPEEVVGSCVDDSRSTFHEALQLGRSVLAELGAPHLACWADESLLQAPPGRSLPLVAS